MVGGDLDSVRPTDRLDVCLKLDDSFLQIKHLSLTESLGGLKGLSSKFLKDFLLSPTVLVLLGRVRQDGRTPKVKNV